MSAEAARAADLLTQLSSPERLLTYAELVRRGPDGASLSELSAAVGLSVPKVGDACARLVALGLATGATVFRARPHGLRDAASALDDAQPITRLLSGYPQLRGNFAHGRLTSLPPTLSDRYDVIGELLSRYLALDGLCTEDEINQRLTTVTDDVAGVRRMLVETGWLERDRAGTTYGQGKRVRSGASSASRS